MSTELKSRLGPLCQARKEALCAEPKRRPTVPRVGPLSRVEETLCVEHERRHSVRVREEVLCVEPKGRPSVPSSRGGPLPRREEASVPMETFCTEPERRSSVSSPREGLYAEPQGRLLCRARERRRHHGGRGGRVPRYRASSCDCSILERQSHGTVLHHCKQKMNINPHPTGTPDFPPPSGGGGRTPPSISAPIGRREKREKHSKARQK